MTPASERCQFRLTDSCPRNEKHRICKEPVTRKVGQYINRKLVSYPMCENHFKILRADNIERGNILAAKREAVLDL